MPSKSQTKKQKASEPQPEGSIEISFTATRVLEYMSIDPLPGKMMSGEGNLKFGFTVNVNFGITEELDRIIILLAITGYLETNPNEHVCVLKTEHVFSTPGLHQFKKSDESIDLPKPIKGIVISTAVGMARGIMFAKNFGTTYADVVVPMFDLDDLIPPGPFRLKDLGPLQVAKIR